MNESVGVEPVVILGAGNGGLAMAGDLALQGRQVLLYERPDLDEGFLPVAAAKAVVVQSGPDGEPEGRGVLALATHDLEEALDGAGMLHLVLPTFAQETFFELLSSRLGAGQTVIVWAGRFGALRFAKLHEERFGGPAPFTIVEVNTLPYGARRTGGNEVRITFRAIRLCAVAIVPSQTAAAVERIGQLYPVVEAAESVLLAAFQNSAMPVLAVGAVLNVGAIETRGAAFSLFLDGMTPAVRQAIAAVYGEMRGVGTALGFAITDYPPEVFLAPASIEGANFRDEAGGTDGFFNLTGPDRIYHRYTVENVAYGLAVVAGLGRQAGVATPTIDAVCRIVAVACGPAFAREGRSLDALGLGISP